MGRDVPSSGTPRPSMAEASPRAGRADGVDKVDEAVLGGCALVPAAGLSAQATTVCLDDDRFTTRFEDQDEPSTGGAFWYVVRGENSAGNGTYDSLSASQVGSRDAETNAFRPRLLLKAQPDRGPSTRSEKAPGTRRPSGACGSMRCTHRRNGRSRGKATHVGLKRCGEGRLRTRRSLPPSRPPTLRSSSRCPARPSRSRRPAAAR